MGLFGAGKKRILIADDEPPMCMLLAGMLSERFETDTAFNGLEALEKALQKTPDLLLLDIDMPGMNGLQLVRALRADEKTRAAKIIMVTGRSTLDAVEELLKAGADDYVMKPVDIAKLKLKVEKILQA